MVFEMWDGEDDARALGKKGTEVWAIFTESPDYWVSNLGRIRSLRRGRDIFLKGSVQGADYRSVSISHPISGTGSRTWLVHRLVIYCFDGPPPQGKSDVRHVHDPDPTNNALWNLAYGTRSENMLDVAKHRRQGRERTAVRERGEAWYTGYTGDDYLLETALQFWGDEKLSVQDLSLLWRCSVDIAHNIVHGKTHKHVKRPEKQPKRYRTAKREEHIMSLVRQGKNARAINAELGETLSAQDVYYRKMKAKRSPPTQATGSIFLTRDQLLKIPKAQREAMVPDLVRGWQEHLKAHPFYPEQKYALGQALDALRGGKKRIASVYLKAVFRSYWDVLGGPIEMAQDPRAFERVLRYRMGLNNSKLYTYKVDGEEVQATETFNLTPDTLRFGFVVQRMSASFFSPSKAYHIIDRWCPEGEVRYFDPSGGFGARMLAFAAARPEGHYSCCEPARSTRNDLLDLSQKLPLNVLVSPVGSEAVSIPPDSIDFIFTSPPYYDKEKYSNDEGQSWVKFPTETEWEAGYLLPTMKTCFSALMTGCFAIFNVDEPRREMFLRAAALSGFLLHDEERLSLPADHFSRKAGRNATSEPVLVFRKP